MTLNASLAKAKNLMGAGEYGEAKSVLAAILGENPGTCELYELAADACLKLGDIAQGRRYLKFASSAKPSAELYAKLAQVTGFEDNHHAVRYLLKARQIAGNDAEALCAVGEGFAAKGLHYSALEAFSAALLADASSTRAKNGQDAAKTEIDGFYPTVTFYLPCYNASQYIAACVESVLAQTYKPSQVLVIDDGSTDNSREIVANYPVTLVRHEVNKGLSAGRNTALSNATGELVASIDSDVIVEPFWLEYLVILFKDSRVGGVNGRMEEGNTLALADRWRSYYMRQHHGLAPLSDLRMLFGCDSVYRTEPLKKIGGYNAGLRTNNEDYDAATRLWENGWEFRYEPRALCRHLREDTQASVLRTNSKWFEPYFDRLGQYAYFHKLTERLRYDIDVVIDHIETAKKQRLTTATYLTVLKPFHHTLTNLLFFRNKHQGHLDAESFREIAGEMVLSIKVLLLKRKVNQELIDRIFADVKPYVDDLLGPGFDLTTSQELELGVEREIEDFFTQGLYKPVPQKNSTHKWSERCEEFVKEIMASGTRKVICYGAGEVGKAFVDAAAKHGLQVACLVDRNSSLWGKHINYVPIVSLKDAAAKGINTFAVTSFAFTEEICRNIRAQYKDSNVEPAIFTKTN